MEDVCELSYLLTETENEKITLEKDDLEIDSSLMIEINRFSHETESYKNMIQYKNNLKGKGGKITQIIELSLIKLEEIASSLGNTEKTMICVEQINEFINQKRELIQRINEMKSELNLLSESIEVLEKTTTSNFPTEFTEMRDNKMRKEATLTEIQMNIGQLSQSLNYYSQQIDQSKDSLEGIIQLIDEIEETIQQRKNQLLSLDQTLQETRFKSEQSLSQLSTHQINLSSQILQKQVDVESLTNELATNLTKLDTLNIVLQSLIEKKIETADSIFRLQLECENMKSCKIELGDQIRQSESESRTLEAVISVTQSAVIAQQKIAASYQEQSQTILESRTSMSNEITQMAQFIDETKVLISQIDEQNMNFNSPPFRELLNAIAQSTEKQNSLLKTLDSLRHRKLELTEHLASCRYLECSESTALESVKNQIESYQSTNSVMQTDIESLETTSNSLHLKLEDAEALEKYVERIQNSLEENESELETHQSLLKTLDQEHQNLQNTNDERDLNFQSSQKILDVDRRLEKRKLVLRSRNTAEILQMQNKIQTADEVFQNEIKKSNEEYLKEKTLLEEEIEGLRSSITPKERSSHE